MTPEQQYQQTVKAAQQQADRWGKAYAILIVGSGYGYIPKTETRKRIQTERARGRFCEFYTVIEPEVG